LTRIKTLPPSAAPIRRYRLALIRLIHLRFQR
jgi:hypothetical protein